MLNKQKNHLQKETFGPVKTPYVMTVYCSRCAARKSKSIKAHYYPPKNRKSAVAIRVPAGTTVTLKRYLRNGIGVKEHLVLNPRDCVIEENHA